MDDKIYNSEVFNFKDKVEYSDNGIISKKIIQKPMGNVTLFSFDTGQELSEHSAPFDAIVQVIDGSAEIIINKISHTVQSGESIIMPANNSHAVVAKSRFKMLLTMIKE